jgi:hypothetical protein
VLERCSIRPGTVAAIDGDRALVTVRPITWDGARLSDGDEVDGWYRLGAEGVRIADPTVGDRVAVHWDWVCERLDGMRERRLRRWTNHSRRLAERGLTEVPFVSVTERDVS